MPHIYGYYKLNRIIGITDQKANDKLNEINTKLNNFDINIGIVVTDKPEDYVREQENYWQGGNPNDFVIFLGKNGDNISYVDTIAWENNYLKIKIRDNILNSKLQLTDLDKILDIIYGTIREVRFKEMDFNKFSYIKTQFSLGALIGLYILSIIASVGIMEYFRQNEWYEEDYSRPYRYY